MKILLVVVGIGACLGQAGSAWAGDDDAKARWEEANAEYFHGGQAAEGQEPDFGTSASLAELLAYAESNNPRLRASHDRWKAALEQAPQAGSLPDPRFSYAYFIEPVETRVGPQRQKFGLSQTIPLFGQRGLREDVELQAANVAGARFETERLELRYLVTRTWSEYYYLSRAIAVTEENLELLKKIENVALAQYAAGRTPHSVLIRAQVELGQMENRLRSLQDQRGPLSASLNAEINRPGGALVAWPDSLVTRSLDHSLEELGPILLERNPQLAALTHQMASDTGAARLAGKNSLPDLTLGVDYIDTRNAAYGDFPDSGKDAVIATASINIPLWSGRRGAEKSQAAARLSSTENDFQQARNRLLAQLERTHFELRDAERRAELYAYTLLPKARQAVAVTTDAFKSGEADFLELIDAQRTLLEFELAAERARADQAIQRAKLEQIVGTELDAGAKAED